MSSRKQDVARILNAQGDSAVFDSFELKHDLTSPSEVTITLGDDGAWRKVNEFAAPGSPLYVFIGNSLQITGRSELLAVDGSDGGIQIKIAIRSKLSDALVASAEQSVRTHDVSIKKFIVQLFAPLGLNEQDFRFDAKTAVDLISGKSSPGQGARTDLEAIAPPKAKVQPGESIYECAARHLERHGLVIMDGPDGLIYVFTPDPFATPLYHFRMRRGTDADRKANNIVRFRKLQDWSGVPSELWMFGQTFGGELTRKSIHGIAANEEVLKVARYNSHFNRKVIGQRNELRNADQAQRRAWRELTNLRKDQDSWEIDVDGLSYWDGSRANKFSAAATCTVDCDVTGSPSGQYMITAVRLVQDERGSMSTLRATRSDLIQLMDDPKFGKPGKAANLSLPDKWREAQKLRMEKPKK